MALASPPTGKPTIPGLAASDVAPLLSPGFDPGSSALSTQDYYVLTRVDGKTSLGQILLICGLPQVDAVAILRRLHELGAIHFPGETPRPKPATVPPTNRPATAPAANKPLAVPAAPTVAIDESLLDEVCDLSLEIKRALLVKQALIKTGTLFDLLDVPVGADKKEIKRAYFKISKDFHPDRYFGKNLGSYKARLAQVFEAATKAFERLSDDDQRTKYLSSLSGEAKPEGKTDLRRAQDLIDRAQIFEGTGDLASALTALQASLKIDPQGRIHRRAAEVALKAQKLPVAEEHGRKATSIDPKDAQAHRTLARVLRAAGRLPEALTELETASRLDPESPFIAAELADLKKTR
jgi:tetratricopeptide (TPR) repeat protein